MWFWNRCAFSEVRMAQCLLCGDSLLRIHCQKSIKKIKSLWVKWGVILKHKLIEFLLVVLLGAKSTPIGELTYARPDVFWRIATFLIDQLELFCFLVPFEKGLTDDDLSHDTSHGPHVNRKGVLTLAKKKLRRTIPESDYIIGVEMTTSDLFSG